MLLFVHQQREFVTKIPTTTTTTQQRLTDD